MNWRLLETVLVSCGNSQNLVGSGLGICVTRKGVLRLSVVCNNKMVCVPSDSWPRGVKGVGKVEVPI